MSDIPIDKPPSLHAPTGANEIPSDDDLGLNDPENILYVNMRGEGLPERFRERIAELEHMLQLTHQLVTIHCGIQVKRRKEEGLLPTDDSDGSRRRRAAYRVKVMEVYFQDGIYPWLVSHGGRTLNEQISVDKSRFHWELLAKMLVGLTLPRPIAASLEAIFQNISETITEADSTSTSPPFLGVLQLFTYDEIRDDIRASLRGINYTPQQEMQTIVKTKNTRSTIDMNFAFAQADYAFNESTWSLLKSEVENYILQTGIGNIRDPPTVPV